MQEAGKATATRRVFTTVTLAALWLAGAGGGFAAEPAAGKAGTPASNGEQAQPATNQPQLILLTPMERHVGQRQTNELGLIAIARQGVPDGTNILMEARLTRVDQSRRQGGEKSRLVCNLEAGKQQTVVTYGTSLTAIGPWVGQFSAELNRRYPGLATVVNSGQRAMWSNNQMYRDVAAQRHLTLIDHYPNWQQLLKADPRRFSEYIPDFIHPNAEGCKMVVTPSIISALGMGAEEVKEIHPR